MIFLAMPCPDKTESSAPAPDACYKLQAPSHGRAVVPERDGEKRRRNTGKETRFITVRGNKDEYKTKDS